LSDNNTFTKAERLCSQAAIDWLFDGKGNSFSVFPLRIIFKVIPSEATTLPKLLISVPKKKFHHAVNRNRVKRMLREAYRKQKHALVAFATAHDLSITLAFVYISDEQVSYTDLEKCVSTAQSRIIKTLEHELAD
jgi:ribonuclease P protein component